MKAPLYNIEGKKTGEVEVSDKIFGVRWNATLVHEVITILQSSRRAGTAHTKGRGEVRGGGKKPWRQKGTGRARHGSTRSPIWIGGGTTHGPRTEKVYERKLNKMVRRKALATVLSKKLKDGEILFVDKITFPEGKTKTAASALKVFSAGVGAEKFGIRGGRALILLGTSESATIRSIRNIPFIDVDQARNINAETALLPKYVLITKDAVEKITA
ncbi:MAG: 50S ribosomal protein L4 [Patescibacteria group bacterium]